MSRTDVDVKTITDFGNQWTRFPQSTGWLASQECLQDHFGPLLDIGELAGARIADIGSGSGRIVKMLLDAGASRIAAIEPSDAFYIMQRNLASEQSRIEFIHDRGEEIGRLKDLDFVISFGVLHHIVDPAPVVRAAHEALRPGGRIAVWLYGHEGNETYLSVFNTVRRITKLLPDPALSALASALNIALDVYIPLSRILPLPMRAYMQNHLGKLDRRMRKLTVFDQLNPAYAKYYTENEARALLETAGFRDVQLYHRHGYSWTVTGTRMKL